jgi:oxygen-dependent protoporphyrinogen oxidase
VRTRSAHVVVLGGGIAGLAAAHAVRRDAPRGTRVTLVEAAGRLGGKLRTEEFAGRPVDSGADAFLARVPAGVRLSTELGLADQLVSPATGTAYVYAAGRLRPLPAGTVLGVPDRLGPLARSRVLSARAMLRAAAEPLLPGGPLREDTAVGELVARRYGAQVVDRLVDPLLGGVYAGSARDLSVDATAPLVAAAARASRSLAHGLRARRPPAVSGPVFHSFAGGMSVLVDRLVAALAGTDVRVGVQATELARTPTGWRVTLGDHAGLAAGAGVVEADAVVVALPASPTAKLLADVAPHAAADLAAIGYASVGIVTLAYPPDAVAVHRPGSGFLVAATERLSIKACTWSWQKWAHLLGEPLVLRCSVGRAGESEHLQRDDEDLVAVVHRDLQLTMGLAAPPLASRVSRWGGALPQYAVGHLERVDRVERAVGALPGLAVAGAAYRGVGIPACIESGERAAAGIVAALRGGTMLRVEGERTDG